ncbi:MAG TPA: hypothetical protein VFT04_11400 [Gemmatimonadales bacterium]|nr:hypothetical protein [Gemmatimonadales bacterium]
MRSFVLAFAAAAGALPLAAQVAAPAGGMRQLDWLIGEWNGTGTMSMGTGRQHEGSIVERATRHAGGHAITLEGLGKAAQAAGDSIVVHDAFALIWYDAGANAFRMKTFRATGHTVEPEIAVSAGKIVWGFTDPRAGRIRFTVTHLPDDRWHEVGEASRDGTTWMKFFEMNLTRAARARSLPAAPTPRLPSSRAP